jgi:hypothetical protein
LVAAWELPNEPDVHYVKDLPDRFAAYSKAIYLGLRDGIAAAKPDRRPAVLMGALGNFPGPWLDRAAENGLFDYTDGLNIHFYGHGRDLAGAIRAQRAFADRAVSDRTLPIWLTECGINAVPFDEVEEARGREIQRAFTVETARAALDEGVAVFMPFVMNWRTDPFWSLIRDSGEPYPAWTDYSAFTRDHSLGEESAVARPAEPNRIVVQWLPDNATCIPHKIGGIYWFRGTSREPQPMNGRWAVYNFSSAAVGGSLTLASGGAVRVERAGEGAALRIPPFGSVEIPVTVVPLAKGYFRAEMSARFEPTVERAGGRASAAHVRVGPVPGGVTLEQRISLAGSRPAGPEKNWIWAPERPVASGAGGAWVAWNGVRVMSPTPERRASLEAGTRFVVDAESTDPRLPPVAATVVDGLPEVADGFLRLRYGVEGPSAGGIRVDLIDAEGQRFSVAEQLGRNPRRDRPDEVLLAYEDFHLYAWGRITDQTEFRPEAVREIQLRFYPVRKSAEFDVRLDVIAPGLGRGL